MKPRRRPQLESLERRSLLSGLSYNLTSSAPTTQPGQPVVFTFKETNTSLQPISVEEGPSIDGFQVQQGGKTIWQSNTGAQPMFVVLNTLQPGQSLTLSATWDGKPDIGNAPATGTFTVFNELAPQATTTVKVSDTATTSTPPSVTTSTPPSATTSTPPTAPGRDPPAAPSTTTTPPAVVPAPTGSSSTAGLQPSSQAAEQPPIVVSVATDRAHYRRGHRVRFSLTLRNDGSTPATLPIDSVESFTLLEGSRPIWKSTRAISGVGAVTLQPGQSVDYTSVWNGKAHSRGLPIQPGTYTLDAGAEGFSGSTTFRILA